MPLVACVAAGLTTPMQRAAALHALAEHDIRGCCVNCESVVPAGARELERPERKLRLLQLAHVPGGAALDAVVVNELIRLCAPSLHTLHLDGAACLLPRGAGAPPQAHRRPRPANLSAVQTLATRRRPRACPNTVAGPAAALAPCCATRRFRA